MLQQILAVLIIVFFLARLLVQKKKKQIGASEFSLWLVFWLVTLVAIIFIKQIDSLVHGLGFSGPGIEILLYVAVLTLFYFVFKLRLRLEKLEKELTKIVQEIALKK